MTADWEVLGRLVDASNATFHVRRSGVAYVYKPVAGERPLWDFPGRTLGRREVAAYELDQMLGWDLVPATSWVEDGPFGPGMVQHWVTAAGSPVDLFRAGEVPNGWAAIVSGLDDGGREVALAHRMDEPALARLVLFDVLANNADRKGGHVLDIPAGGLAAVDHGLTFHTEPKLRTVLWGFAGQAIPGHMLSDVERVVRSPGEVFHRLRGLVSQPELAACLERGRALLAAGSFPLPETSRRVIPWPPL